MHKQQIIIISLTDKGRDLANGLAKKIEVLHHHKPYPFASTIQQFFNDNHPLIFITATGIAVRSLAPVINSKLSDPPVLVMDEQGEFVIPLLSGHQGGANEWARKISHLINAQLVITTAAPYQKPVYVLGMGCDKGCPESYLQSLIDEHISHDQLANISALASIDLKQNEPALLSLSKRLNLPFICYASNTLNTVSDQLSYKSDIVYREVGCYGVAEAAALIHASHLTHQTAELAIIKQKNKRATLALARSYPTFASKD